MWWYYFVAGFVLTIFVFVFVLGGSPRAERVIYKPWLRLKMWWRDQ